ncbi:MAG: hypothetical protein ACYCXG_07110 [Acidiferrobacter sp.]
MPATEGTSAADARAEADRHRRDLTASLDELGARVGQAVDTVERRVTIPVRWIREHPLAALSVAIVAGAVLGARRAPTGRDGLKRSGHELEAAYSLGRRDEAQHQPARPPQDFGPVLRDDRGGHNMELMALLFAAAKPLVSQLAHSLAERYRGNGR